MKRLRKQRSTETSCVGRVAFSQSHRSLRRGFGVGVLSITICSIVLVRWLAAGQDPEPPLSSAVVYAADISPMWSPDGSKIVFASNRSGSFQIYVMDLDGSNVRRLTHRNGYDADPSWSPDGSHIAFCSDRDGNKEIYVMDFDGANPKNLSNHPARDCDTPSWSPGGTKLLFISARDGDWQNAPEDNYEIYVMNADGSNQNRLSHTRGFDLTTGQAWSPDGSQIVFCSSNDHIYKSGSYDDFDIFVMDSDGSNITQLTDSLGEDSYPFWSPDGQTVAYTRFLKSNDGTYDLYTMKPDGSGIKRFTDLPGFEYTLAWAPDGNRVVYASNEGRGVESIFIAGADGSNRFRLTNR